MGKANRQRRAEKKRRDASKARSGSSGGCHQQAHDSFGASRTKPPDLAALAHSAMRRALLASRDRDAASVERYIDELVGLDTARRGSVEVAGGVLSNELVAQVRALWANGWQPADLFHAAGRNDESVAALIGAVLAEEAIVSCGPGRHVPATWSAQLGACATNGWGDVPGQHPFERWMRRGGMTRRHAISVALELLAAVMGFPRLEMLAPPPSEWDRAAPAAMRRPTDVSEVDQRVLSKVRALLAKAESTTFPEEADALSSKAQELMARYAIDHAMVDARGPGVAGPGGVRVHVHDPYAGAKALLLHAVAQANRCRTLEYDRYAFCTVVGYGVDLEVVEVLFTSLLVQATRAVGAAGSVTDRSGRSRTRSFRQSFLIAFASRVGERLREAAAAAGSAAVETFGGDLLPVLASRNDKVDEQFDAWFPTTRSRSTTIGNRDGWLAGRAAADRANLGPQVQLPS